MTNKFSKWVFSLFILCSVLFITSCKKTEIRTTTTEDVNIVGYLEKNRDSFSLFKQILDRTENTAFLNAYGLYTCFAPTNSGVSRWLTSIGAANVDAANINTLQEMVKFHILPDTVSTGSFKDGKLPVPTMHGQYLITGVLNNGGLSSYYINRQAILTTSNVRVGNGIVHVINGVLEPAKLTIAKMLEANPEYSIFVQAMKETGYFDSLNTVNPDTSKRWKTVIAESNRALADSGFASYAALKARFSNTGNPANLNDSLRIYVAYHILDGIKFLGDIINSPSHQTLQPQEVISTQLIDQQVIVNEDVFDGVLEKGVLITRATSDNSATNGVWHTAAAHYKAKLRNPTAVYWDVCAFPEVMKMPAVYKKTVFNFVKQSQEDRPIKDIDWHINPANVGASNSIEYSYLGPTSTLSQNAVNNDVLTARLGPPSRSMWMEFTTPIIIKGRYKVWICYSREQAITSNVRVNDQLMQRPVNFNDGLPAGTDAELESINWKRYTVTTGGGRSASRLVGIVDITSTKRHTVRFEILPNSATNNAGCRLDMIHFIPIDQHQWLPRFAVNGTKVFQ